MWSQREDAVGAQASVGGYGSLEYQFARRWFAGVRYDHSERADDSGVRDKGGSFLLTYWPSEFSQIRGQYRHTSLGDGTRRATSSSSSSCSRSAPTAPIPSERGRHETPEHRHPRRAGARRSRRAAVNVIATTEDLAALAREVGGDKIKVESIARGYQDPHFVEAKPSFILKLAKADLLIAVGRELEIGWLPPLVQQSRNAKVQPGGEGYLDASLTAKILEIPTGQITRAMGDVHPQGNPHYWLDPDNGRRIAKAIEEKLSKMDAADAAYFPHATPTSTSASPRPRSAGTRRWRPTRAPRS